MSGADRSQIVNSDLFWPNGLALDSAKQMLYWVDAKLHTISFVDFNGHGRDKLERVTTNHPFALIWSNGSFYWSDWHTK
jgi:sugar lactone lactonase YvrE